MNHHTSAVRAGRIGLLLVLALSVLSACGSDDPDAPADAAREASVRTYVGRAEGTDAFVAAVVDGSRVLAYLCDGMPGTPVGTAPTLQAWFNGTSDGREVNVEQEGSRLHVDLRGDTMTGVVTLAGGRRLEVSGRAVDGEAGLYRAEATGDQGKAVAGWILSADGEQRGGVGGSGSLSTLSGTTLLNTTQLTFSFQSLATSRISKVGITPIPIP